MGVLKGFRVGEGGRESVPAVDRIRLEIRSKPGDFYEPTFVHNFSYGNSETISEHSINRMIEVSLLPVFTLQILPVLGYPGTNCRERSATFWKEGSISIRK